MDTVVIFRGKVFKIKWGRHNPPVFERINPPFLRESTPIFHGLKGIVFTD